MVGGEGGMQPADVMCFIDEAGDRGYVRNLRPEQDQRVCVLAALPILAEHVDYARGEVRRAFDRFVLAAPDGAKHHITDAFSAADALRDRARHHRATAIQYQARCEAMQGEAPHDGV